MKQVLKQGYYSILYSTNFNMTAAVLQSLESWLCYVDNTSFPNNYSSKYFFALITDILNINLQLSYTFKVQYWFIGLIN